jgi:redox-sensitive bicupin YhaK (pirin superfamily)
MVEFREIQRISRSLPTLEGAGVKLKRAFGYSDVRLLDPFLLLDDFHSEDPDDYSAGFPWHPHRGIETVTYVLKGMVEHGDSIGNKGVIGSGDVQWMTAGSGIIHQEMPKGSRGLMWGFQLWVNLPSSYKMTDPRYREIRNVEIPVVQVRPGVTIKVIRGTVDGNRGPVRDLVVDCDYFDVKMEPNTVLEHPIMKTRRAFAYVTDGQGYFSSERARLIESEHLVVFGDGDRVKISASDTGLRYLLISGQPIGEPVAWRGPIVMNTEEELDHAFAELGEGTFLKHAKSSEKQTSLGYSYYNQ